MAQHSHEPQLTSVAPADLRWKSLPAIPSLGAEYRAAVKDILPVLATSRRAGIPTSAVEVTGVRIDLAHYAEYCAATGLRLNDSIAPTYPYVLAFPLMMELMTAEDFPYKAIGTVHLRNVIEQTRPLTTGDFFTIRVFTSGVRVHSKGVLVDLTTEICTDDGTLVWRQTSTMLGLGGKDKARAAGIPDEDFEPLDFDIPTDPTATVAVTPAQIARYAAVSGDRNPIHVSKLGAKAFGFPRTIAHGMWTAAALLAHREGLLPEALRYRVEFGKPVLLPARMNVSVVVGEGIGAPVEIAATSAKKAEIVHVRATVEQL